MSNSKLKLIECPRDAMQGIHEFIPTEKKVAYINSILKCGFDTVDFGSFVSAKAIPQMRDTALVLEQLELNYKAAKADLNGLQAKSIISEGKWLKGFIPFAASLPSHKKRYTSSERLGTENKSNRRKAIPAIINCLKWVTEKNL